LNNKTPFPPQLLCFNSGGKRNGEIDHLTEGHTTAPKHGFIRMIRPLMHSAVINVIIKER